MHTTRLPMIAALFALACTGEDKDADGYDCGEGTIVEDGVCVR